MGCIYFFINPQEKPRIINSLPDRLASEMNSEVRIDCMAIGSPRPEIRWYKDGNQIQQYQNGFNILNNGSLLIGSLQPYDNGLYECMAISESGNDTIEITIDTQGWCYLCSPPSMVFFSN